MANHHSCGCSGRRDPHNGYGCLGSVGGRWRWENYPYYDGPCPDADGVYEAAAVDGGRRSPKRGRGGCWGMFTAMLPMAVAPNGIIPLVNTNCQCRNSDFNVNSGLISVEQGGTYLATYTVRMPEGAALDSTITLNVNDAAQASAIAEIGGQGPAGCTAQAIFDVCDHATVTLRSSEAINLPNTAAQPLFTLSLVRLD